MNDLINKIIGFLIVIIVFSSLKASESGTNNTDFLYFEETGALLLNKVYVGTNRYCMINPDTVGSAGFQQLNKDNLGLATWSPQYVIGSQYGDNVFALVNNNKLLTPLIVNFSGFQFYYVGVSDYPSSIDLSTTPDYLWQIELNTSTSYYSIKNCSTGRYITAENTSKEPLAVQSPFVNASGDYYLYLNQKTYDDADGNSWWSAMVPPSRLSMPFLFNVLVSDGNEGADYLSITSSDVQLINTNDAASTNLYLMSGHATTIPQGVSFLLGGDIIGSPCLKYNPIGDDTVYSSSYSFDDESTIWSVLPYRYLIYTIQTSDGRFLIKKSSQAVGLSVINDSIITHPEALWSLLDSYDNYTSAAIPEESTKISLSFVKPGAEFRYMNGDMYSNDVFPTDQVNGTMSVGGLLEFVPYDDSNESRKAKHYGISLRKFGKSIIHAFDKTKMVISDDIDKAVKFVDSVDMIAQPFLWNPRQIAPFLFNLVHQVEEDVNDVINLVKIVGTAVWDFYTYRYSGPESGTLPGHVVTYPNKYSSNQIYKALTNWYNQANKASSITNPSTWVPPFYCSNDLINNEGTGTVPSDNKIYLALLSIQVQEWNRIATSTRPSYKIGINDCDVYATCLSAQVYSSLISTQYGASGNPPAFGLINIWISGQSHVCNFYMTNKNVVVFDSESGTILDPKYVTFKNTSFFSM